jgi:hypothetical protein
MFSILNLLGMDYPRSVPKLMQIKTTELLAIRDGKGERMGTKKEEKIKAQINQKINRSNDHKPPNRGGGQPQTSMLFA